MNKKQKQQSRIRILGIFTAAVTAFGLGICVAISSLAGSSELTVSRVRPKTAHIEVEEEESALPGKTTAAVKKLLEEIIAETQAPEAETFEEEYIQEEAQEYIQEIYEEIREEEETEEPESFEENYEEPVTEAESPEEPETTAAVISGLRSVDISFTEEEILLLIYTVSAEAGASPYETQLTVANVIIDRAADCGSITDAIYAPGQFSVTWNGALEKAMERGADDVTIQAVKDALSGVDTRTLPYYYFNNIDMGYTGEWIGDVYFYLIG